MTKEKELRKWERFELGKGDLEETCFYLYIFEKLPSYRKEIDRGAFSISSRKQKLTRRSREENCNSF